jgi:hypothetical protein
VGGDIEQDRRRNANSLIDHEREPDEIVISQIVRVKTSQPSIGRRERRLAHTPAISVKRAGFRRSAR